MEQVVFIGLGRVGLPQALVATDAGYKVFGIDTNQKLIEDLKAGRTPFYEPDLDELLSKHINKNFTPTGLEQLESIIPSCSYIFIAIGVEVDYQTGQINLNHLNQLINKIIHSKMKSNTIIVLRSTVPIGTVDSIKSFIENQISLKEGSDFHLAFIPERIVEGQAIREEKRLPKIIGTYSLKAYELAAAFFEKIGGKLIRVSNPKTAELAKLTDNCFRNTQFAFSNELAFLAENYNINAFEVINACNADYPRNSIPFPGPVSGYCLSKDPYILNINYNEITSKRGYDSLWIHGRKINDQTIKHCVASIIKGVQSHFADKPHIMILGLSYKEDIDDFRMSHSLQLINEIYSQIPAATISAYDPNMGKGSYTLIPQYIDIHLTDRSNSLDSKLFQNVNVIIIASRGHDIINVEKTQKLESILSNAKRPLLIYDLWNVWPSARNLKNIYYYSLGNLMLD
jgi:UDP-N-acetyl-D-mannosaminuronic acid dehydrogenase